MGDQLRDRPHFLTRQFDLQLTADIALHGNRRALTRRGKLGNPIHRTPLLAVSNQSAWCAGAKTARHAQHVHGLKDTRFAATVGTEEYIDPSQLAERDLGQISNMVNLQLG